MYYRHYCRFRDSHQSDLMALLKDHFHCTNFHNESVNGVKKMVFEANPKINPNVIERTIKKSLDGLRNVNIEYDGNSWSVAWTERGLPSDITANFDELFDKYVPHSGKADTIAGEILRAFNKIEYRWFNDGDKFYTGYGKKTAGSFADYLYTETNDDIANALENMVGSDYTYEKGIAELKQAVIAYLVDNPELFNTDNDDDSMEWSTDDIDELEPREDYYIDYEKLGGDSSVLEDIGFISNTLLTEWVDSWINDSPYLSGKPYEVNRTSDGCVVEDLVADDENALENTELAGSWDTFLEYCDDEWQEKHGFSLLHITNKNNLRYVLDLMENSYENGHDIKRMVDKLEKEDIEVDRKAEQDLIEEVDNGEE